MRDTSTPCTSTRKPPSVAVTPDTESTGWPTSCSTEAVAVPSSSPNRPAACGRWRSPSWLCPPTSSPSPSWDATSAGSPSVPPARSPLSRTASPSSLGVFSPPACGGPPSRVAGASRPPPPSSPTTSSCSRSRRSSCSRVPETCRPRARASPFSSAFVIASRPSRASSSSCIAVLLARGDLVDLDHVGLVLLVGEVHAPLARRRGLQEAVDQRVGGLFVLLVVDLAGPVALVEVGQLAADGRLVEPRALGGGPDLLSDPDRAADRPAHRQRQQPDQQAHG